MNSPTIVAASLSDKDLRDSIEKLVQHVDSQSLKMAQNFDAAVSLMKESLRTLGNTKVDFGGMSDGGATRRTRSQQAETQAVKETTMSYDQLAKAQQVAARSASDTSNSYSNLIQQIQRTQIKFDVDPLQQLRMRQHELEAGMKTASENAAKAKKDVDELNQVIENYRKTMTTLPQTQQGFANRQAIQKEINDLATLRDAAIEEQKKWNAAGQQLATQYEGVKNEIRQIGQALIDAEQKEKDAAQQQTNELDKQLQKIKEINSAKSAKTAYENISSMPTDTIDQANAKLQALQALKEKVANTPLLSKTSQAQISQSITDTKGKIEQLEMSARGTNQSKKSLDDLNAAVRQSIIEEQKRRDAILQTGVAAQETFAKIRQSTQIQLADNTDKPILGVKELTSAIQDMERAYWSMENYNRESPLGQSLKRDIENAKNLRAALDAYNRSLYGMPVMHGTNELDKSLGSYMELSNILKTLTDEYRRLGREERNAARGDDLANKIQRLGRETQKIQQQMNRPINLEAALGGSEKTLDDIAYKMQRLQAYKRGIDLTKPEAADEIKKVDDKLRELQKDADKWMGKQKGMIEGNDALGRSWNYMKNRLAFYVTVGASTQFIKNLIEVRSQYEMNERALGILINSAERGTQIFNELSQMALVSPYTLIEFSSAAKQLVAYDVAAKDVVDTTRRLADMASAVGVPMERLTYALGQIKAYGYLNSRDARMFANAGIPLVKQLSDYYTELEGKMVSVGDVYDRMKKKAIDYNDVMAVVTKMTDEGGKFFDFQAKMAETLKVRLANLTLAWNNMLNDMGKESQGVLTWGIGALRELFLHWKQLDAAIKDAAWILGIRTGFMLIAFAALKAGNALGVTSRQMALSSVVGTRLAGVLNTLGKSLATIVKSPITWWSLLALAAWDIFDAVANSDRATKEFNKSLRDNAKTTYEDLKKFAEQYKNIRDSLSKTETIKDANGKELSVTTPQNINESEAKKAWEAVREQIELSSHASDEYISKLLSIQNVSERLRQGFNILDDIQTVTAALKELGDDGIKVTQGWSAWWNAWQGADGLIQNLKDLQKELNRVRDAGFDPNDKFTKTIDKDYRNALERFRKDLKVTTDSVLDFINNQGWSGDTGKIDETFKQITDMLAKQGQLDPQTVFTLQKDVEIARSEAVKNALEIRIADEKNALAAASDDISKERIRKNLETLEKEKRDFDMFNGENRAYWNDFTKYIKERHISELTSAYNSMTDNGKKAMDYQSEEWQKRVHNWANAYEKSHNLATDSVFNRLKNWIKDANTWSVFIKMTISTEDGKSVYKQLEEYDKAADDAWKTMQRLDKRIRQLRKKGAKEIQGEDSIVVDLKSVSADDKELTNALKERTQAQKDYNEAVAKGGESKKEDAAGRKAQKAAESELQKALKDQLQLIDKVRSQYDKLAKTGADSGTALVMVTNQFSNSIAHINRILGKNGLPLFDINTFTGKADPHELLGLLKAQLDAARLAKNIKPEEIKELELKYSEIVVDAKTYDLTMITKGLNNELDKLKDEYELAVALDADPELGSMFMDLWGINEETLPHTAQEYADRYTKALNKYLAENKKDLVLPNLLNVTSDDMAEFQRLMEAGKLEEKYFELIKNGYQATHDARQKEATDAIKNWDKLLEKYSEYQYKLKQIQDNANKERKDFVMMQGTEAQKNLAASLFSQINAAPDDETKNRLIEQLKQLVTDVAGDDKTKIQLKVAIDTKEAQESAKTAFEEFQKSPEWIVATGDLSGMTDKALGGLIQKLEEYKKKAKNLDSKQIKQLNNALKNLYKQQRQGNPFAAIVNAMNEAKSRAEEFQPAIDEVEKELKELEENKDKGNIAETADEIEKLTKRLKELKKEQNDAGKVSATDIVSGINSAIQVAQQATSVFTDMVDALGGTKASRDIKRVFSVLEKGGQGAAIGAQIGGGYGAIIGSVVGTVSGIVQTFADQWSGNASITRKVEESVRSVKRLEIAYKDLDAAVNDAYGTAVIGAQKAAIANKELQLAELNRQLQLEQSRKAKNRDDDRILDLQGQIKDLEYEIKEATNGIVNDLLGISSVGDFAENLVSEMITAFKNGEDYMEVFEGKFEDMIDNMIMKSIATRVVSQYMDALWDSLDEKINQRSNKEAEDYAKAQAEAVRRANMTREDAIYEIIGADKISNFTKLKKEIDKVTDKDIEDYINAAKEEEKAAKARLDAATALTDSDIDFVMSQIGEIMPELGEKLKNILGEYYKFGESSETQLSALQQGISSVSEETASAVEAYLNSMSQQAYLRNDLLTQIRDAVVAMDSDAQLGVFSQMLSQLQTNYTVMMSMQSMMEGWTTPNGQGIRVVLIS